MFSSVRIITWKDKVWQWNALLMAAILIRSGCDTREERKATGVKEFTDCESLEIDRKKSFIQRRLQPTGGILLRSSNCDKFYSSTKSALNFNHQPLPTRNINYLCKLLERLWKCFIQMRHVFIQQVWKSRFLNFRH